MHNVGIEVVEDTIFLMDNPGDHPRNVDSTTDSSTGGYLMFIIE